MSREALARGADRSTASVTKIENGDRRPSLGMLLALVNTLDCPVGELFEPTVVPPGGI